MTSISNTSDCVYTPPSLAARMVETVVIRKQMVWIADFAAGDGQLLKAAQVRWPKAQVAAVDIDRAAVTDLRKANPSWQIERLNFLSRMSRSRSELLRDIEGKASLILLNPPFSCRGARTLEVNFNGHALRCSLALAFAIISIGYLSPAGEFVAVLPMGSLGADKDREAWSVLRRYSDCRVIAANGQRTFPGYFPKTVLVHVCLRKLPVRTSLRTPRIMEASLSPSPVVSLVRGVMQMHAVPCVRNRVAWPLIHTTDLAGRVVDCSKAPKSTGGRRTCGPAVLVPRVGMPKKSKVSLHLTNQEIVLSDCVIGIKCNTIKEAKMVQEAMQDKWHLFEKRYGGTCARYITVQALKETLQKIGVKVM